MIYQLPVDLNERKREKEILAIQAKFVLIRKTKTETEIETKTKTETGELKLAQHNSRY